MSQTSKKDEVTSTENKPSKADPSNDNKLRPFSIQTPDYMKKIYNWAYVDPQNVFLLDRPFVVWAILWGNSGKLAKAAYEEFELGQKVLMPAHVYGTFVPGLAKVVGSEGKLDVLDVTPIQVTHCEKKLKNYPWASVQHADAAYPPPGKYDGVCCFFLLHEIPDDYKYKIVNALLNKVESGGKVVFVDYHDPAKFHPLRKFMYLIFRKLEPLAFGLIHKQIWDFAENKDDFTWTKKTFFGGLYQKVVAVRK